MDQKFIMSKRSLFLNYIAINLVPFAISVVFYARTGIIETFISNILVAFLCMIHYTIRLKKPKVIMSIGKATIYIDDGFSIPKIGAIERSNITNIAFSKNGLIKIRLNNGREAVFNGKLLSQENQLRVKQLLDHRCNVRYE